jgi:hypothetical protein
VEDELARSEGERSRWLKRVDGFLSTMSWDHTHERMSALLSQVLLNAREIREVPLTNVRRSTALTSHYNVAMEA